jgi:hypothetical protein
MLPFLAAMLPAVLGAVKNIAGQNDEMQSVQPDLQPDNMRKPSLFNGFLDGQPKPNGMEETTGSKVLGGLSEGLGGGLGTGGLFGSLLPSGLDALADLLKKKKQNTPMGGM